MTPSDRVMLFEMHLDSLTKGLEKLFNLPKTYEYPTLSDTEHELLVFLRQADYTVRKCVRRNETSNLN